MSMMMAIRIHAYGGRDVLRYEEAPCPTLNADDVMIRVHAAAVNPVDWAVRAGYMSGWFPHTLPLILGWDVAGVIETVGAEVTQFAVGDAVFARTDILRNGAYAEYMAVRATEVVGKPPALDFVEAAAVPHAALTAWQALFDAAQLTHGQTVLIHGAGGGVGTFAIQLAKWRGANVVGTASQHNLAFLRELGADEVIDYNATRFEEAVHGADVVLDTIGGDTQARSWAVLRPGGTLVSLLQPPSAETAAMHGVQARMIGTQPNAAQLTQIAGLVESGQLKPVVSTILLLSEVSQAHALSESRHTCGKIILRVID